MAYLTADEIRERQGQRVGSEAQFPDELLVGLAASFAEVAERYRGVAYEQRTVSEFHADGSHGSTLVLAWPMVAEVDEITVGGDPWEGSFTLDAAAGIVHGVPAAGHLTITYSHGFESTPEAVKRLCALFVARTAVADQRATSDNAYAVIGADGGVERRGTADWSAGRPTGWLDVDAGLNALTDHRSDGLA